MDDGKVSHRCAGRIMLLIMKEIILTRGLKTVVDDATFENQSGHKWHAENGGGSFYAARKPGAKNGFRKTVYLHREVVCAPIGFEVDHINGNTLDNRISNLRVCTRSQNAKNRKLSRNSSTGLKGVSQRGLKFRSRIWIGGKGICLGTFESASDASKAYQDASLFFFGDFARKF